MSDLPPAKDPIEAFHAALQTRRTHLSYWVVSNSLLADSDNRTECLLESRGKLGIDVLRWSNRMRG